MNSFPKHRRQWVDARRGRLSGATRRALSAVPRNHRNGVGLPDKPGTRAPRLFDPISAAVRRRG